MKKLLTIGFCLLLIMLILYVENSKAEDNVEGKKLVTKIVDGDTLVVENGAIIRLLGIDTDEKEHPCYKIAKNKLEELLLNREVELIKDKENKDKYGRYLRYVFLNNENINLEMIKEGLAVARIQEDIKYNKEFVNAEKEAISNRIGCKWKNIKRENSNEGIINTKQDITINQDTNKDIIDACESKNYIGKDTTIKGNVVSLIKSKKGTLFISLGKNYPNECMTIIIFKNDLSKFKDIQKYKGKDIEISGEIKEYNGKPEIILNDISQIIN